MAFRQNFSQYIANRIKKPAPSIGSNYATTGSPFNAIRGSMGQGVRANNPFTQTQPEAARPTLPAPTLAQPNNPTLSNVNTSRTMESPTLASVGGPAMSTSQQTIQDAGGSPNVQATTLPLYTPNPTPPVLGNPVMGTDPTLNVSRSTDYTPGTPDPNTPARLIDPGAISEAGRLYEGRVTDALQGKDQASADMMERANTQASRNLYMAGKQGQEDALAGGLGAGSLQYQRTQDRALAGAREANLAGAQGLGDFLRTRAEQILARGKGVEDTAYNRATGERDEAGALRLENRGNVDNYINSFGDARFKNYLRSVQAAGGDVYAAAAGGMQNGTIREEYRSQDPVQAAQESAASWVRATQPNLETSDPAKFQSAVVERMRQTDKSITSPISDAEKRVAEQDAIAAWTAGDTLTDEQRKAIVYGNQVPHSTSLPVGSQIDAVYETSPAGLFVVGSTLYKLSKRKPDGASNTYNYATDADGNYKVFFEGRWIPADPTTGRAIQAAGAITQ